MPRDGKGPSPPGGSVANVRVGIGYDSHRFATGRRLILGGILIPSDAGLAGHSDADAVCHAVTDAILGAAALGDIGEMFPDTDQANLNRDSIEMLGIAVARLREGGFAVAQVDVTVIAETPKLAPHREKIRSRLASAMSIESSAVSVKGKTNEGMGWIGRKEGIACIAVATVKEIL